MKKRTAIISIVLLIIILVVAGNYYYLTPRASTLDQMEKDVREYLYTERGYTEEEILEIDVRFDAWKETGIHRYNAIVYFTDEPENDYGYHYDSKDNMKIEPSYIGNGKHNP